MQLLSVPQATALLASTWHRLGGGTLEIGCWCQLLALSPSVTGLQATPAAGQGLPRAAFPLPGVSLILSEPTGQD